MRGLALLLLVRSLLPAQSEQEQRDFAAAVAAQDSGDLKSAEERYRQLLRNHPSALPVIVNLASVLLSESKWDDAVSVLRPAEANARGNPDIAWLLGNALIYSGRTTDGLQRIDALAANGNAAAGLVSAETHLRLDEYDEALKAIDAAIKVDPSLAHVHSMRGMILEHTGNFPASISELSKAIAADPKDVNAQVYLGAILLYTRKLSEAQTHLNEALQAEPTSPLARYEMALLKLAQGSLDGALKDFESVALQQPKWLQPHVELAALYYRLKRPLDGLRERKLVDQLSASPNSFIVPVP